MVAALPPYAINMPNPNSDPSSTDVRMRGFSRRVTVQRATDWIDEQVSRVSLEKVSVVDAAGRVLAEDIVSPVDVPAFPRAMMDGFAVRAADTSGASAYNRLTLPIVGDSLPGSPWSGTL